MKEKLEWNEKLLLFILFTLLILIVFLITKCAINEVDHERCIEDAKRGVEKFKWNKNDVNWRAQKIFTKCPNIPADFPLSDYLGDA